MTTPSDTALVHADRFFQVSIPRFDTPFRCYARQTTNPGNPTGLTVFLVPGMCQTHGFYEPLVAELFAQCGTDVYQTFAMDLPGHGRSEVPDGMRFGDLTLESYYSAAAQMMGEIGTVDVVVGHSMGGIVVQSLEQSLVGLAASLAKSFGTRGVVLLASTMPEEVGWSFAEGILLPKAPISELLVQLAPYLRWDLEHGLHAKLSDKDHLQRFYTSKSGRLASGHPSEPLLRRLNEIEAYGAASEMGGLDFNDGFLERQHIAKGLFKDYVFGLAAFREDLYMTPDEQTTLFDYLSSGTSPDNAISYLWDDDEAVHCAPYSAPDVLVRSFLAGVVARVSSRVRPDGGTGTK